MRCQSRFDAQYWMLGASALGRPRGMVWGGRRVQALSSTKAFTFHFHALEKEMATHSSVLAWRIPAPGKPVGLLSMGSHRVGHD